MTTATVKTKLTHKVGPFPVWVWAALAVAAWFLVFRGPFGAAAKASGGAQLPYTPSSGSGAQQPASGQGNPADNTNGDLLSALQENTSSHDALLAALQYGSYGGYGGYGSGYGAGGGGSTGGVPAPATDTSATTAPTIDSGTGNAPVDSFASPTVTDVPPVSDPYYVIPATDTSPQEYFQPTGYFQNEQGFTRIDPAAVSAALTPWSTMQQDDILASPVSTGPTPYAVVQPAPVDTGGVIDPTPRAVVGKAIAV